MVVKPDVGGSQDIWGEILNDALDELEANAESRVAKDLVNAKGDLLVGSAPDTLTRQPVGADGQVLTADSTASTGVKWGPAGILSGTAAAKPTPPPAAGMAYFETDTNRYWHSIDVGGNRYWAPPPGTTVFSAHSNVAQTITNGSTGVALNFEICPFDLLGGWSSAAKDRYICKLPGRYVATGACGFNVASATGYRYVSWRVSGSPPAPAGTATIGPPATGQPVVVARAKPMVLTLNQYVQLFAGQTSGADAPTYVDGVHGNPEISMIYAGQ